MDDKYVSDPFYFEGSSLLWFSLFPFSIGIHQFDLPDITQFRALWATSHSQHQAIDQGKGSWRSSFPPDSLLRLHQVRHWVQAGLKLVPRRDIIYTGSLSSRQCPCASGAAHGSRWLTALINSFTPPPGKGQIWKRLLAVKFYYQFHFQSGEMVSPPGVGNSRSQELRMRLLLEIHCAEHTVT